MGLSGTVRVLLAAVLATVPTFAWLAAPSSIPVWPIGGAVTIVTLPLVMWLAQSEEGPPTRR